MWTALMTKPFFTRFAQFGNDVNAVARSTAA
jgi:hypothetical protein